MLGGLYRWPYTTVTAILCSGNAVMMTQGELAGSFEFNKRRLLGWVELHWAQGSAGGRSQGEITHAQTCACTHTQIHAHACTDTCRSLYVHKDVYAHAYLENPWQKWAKGLREGWVTKGKSEDRDHSQPRVKGSWKGRKRTREDVGSKGLKKICRGLRKGRRGPRRQRRTLQGEPGGNFSARHRGEAGMDSAPGAGRLLVRRRQLPMCRRRCARGSLSEQLELHRWHILCQTGIAGVFSGCA